MKRYTAAEESYLRANYKTKTNKQLAAGLNRTIASIAQCLNRLRLLRPPECIQHSPNSGQFKKGLVPHNKGQRGVHYSRATEFKPGNAPANTTWDGCIRIRIHTRTGVPYKHIRIAVGKWVTLHRHHWEQANGPIPKTHMVIFKDGNTLNCELENLELISKADNVRRNKNPEKAAIGIRKAWENDLHLKSDKWIAFTLAPSDPDMRAAVLKNPALLELKRLNLKLKRAIKRETRKAAADHKAASSCGSTLYIKEKHHDTRR